MEPIWQNSRYFSPAFLLTTCECVQTSLRFTHRFPIEKLIIRIAIRKGGMKRREILTIAFKVETCIMLVIELQISTSPFVLKYIFYIRKWFEPRSNIH